jgi:hypothetical protein
MNRDVKLRKEIDNPIALSRMEIIQHDEFGHGFFGPHREVECQKKPKCGFIVEIL